MVRAVEDSSRLAQEQSRGAFRNLIEREPPARLVPAAGPVDGAEHQQAHQLRVARNVTFALQVVDHLLPERVIAVLERDDAPAVRLVERAPVIEQHRDEIVAVLQDGADLRTDYPHETLLG